MGVMKGFKDYRQLNHNMYKMNRRQVEKYQGKQLELLLKAAVEGSAFYRSLYQTNGMLGIEPIPHKSEIQKLIAKQKLEESGFFRLPTINKQIMMDNFDSLNTCGLKKSEVLEFALGKEFAGDYTGYYKEKYVVGLSSGTSGNKGLYVTPREITERLPFVFLARGGVPLHNIPMKILFLLRVFSQGFADIEAPLINLTYKSTMTPPRELLEFINKNQVNIIMAPPSMLRILMEYSNQIKSKIKTIVSYAEVLEKEEKERLKKAFNCQVNEIYQASEGPIGSTCKCGNMHINEDLVLVELFDEKGDKVELPGVIPSRMLVTNLVNTAQPLIRYEMNDLVVLGEKCPCGSSFRVIDRILGRNDDVLLLKDEKGEIVHVFPDLFARWIITTEDRIREFQVLQKSSEEIEIKIDLFNIETDAEVRPVDDHAGNAAVEFTNEEETIMEKLKTRIMQELVNFEINCRVEIVVCQIALPEKMSKYKRFIRTQETESSE